MLIEQNILKLDVSVCDALTMAILESNQYLIDDPPCLLLIELLINHLFEIAVQTSSRHILHDEIHMTFCLECFDKLHYIWMVHLLKENNFSSYTPLSIDVR